MKDTLSSRVLRLVAAKAECAREQRYLAYNCFSDGLTMWAITRVSSGLILRARHVDWMSRVLHQARYHARHMVDYYTLARVRCKTV